MIGAETLASIRRKAEALAGRDLGGQGDTLVEMAADAAMAWCCREDIPAEMEGAVAGIAVTLSQGGGQVKSLTRGDTAVTYASAAGDFDPQGLSPWRRLGTVKEDLT